MSFAMALLMIEKFVTIRLLSGVFCKQCESSFVWQYTCVTPNVNVEENESTHVQVVCNEQALESSCLF